MRRVYVIVRSWAAVPLLLVTACGGVAPQHQGTLPLPTPPTAVLAAWSSFPAGAHPRPIVAFGDTVEHVQPAGFPNGDRKIAWFCNRFVFGNSATTSDAVPGAATAAGASYPAISSASAWSDLMASRAGAAAQPQCASLPPFVITAVRWGSASFPTDRGNLTMSAWLFDVPEVNAYPGHSALAPSAYWGGGISVAGRGAKISLDGLTLKVPVANAGPGPCDFDYTATAAESPTAVAVAVRQFSHTAGGQPVACDLVLRTSYISVALRSPLRGRVLLDEKGDAGMVCPESGDC
jgi:hypothetical protein